MRRIPIVATIIVLAAVATMVALGLWQLRRLDEKEALLARYAQAQAMSAEVAFPRTPQAVAGALYRHSRVNCERVIARRTTAGAGPGGESGRRA